MDLGKPQLHAKFEVAGFIYYKNIRKCVLKNWDKPKWGNPLLFADRMFPIQCTTFVELRRQKMGDFYAYRIFIMENFKFLRAEGWRL